MLCPRAPVFIKYNFSPQGQVPIPASREHFPGHEAGQDFLKAFPKKDLRVLLAASSHTDAICHLTTSRGTLILAAAMWRDPR